MKSQLVTFFSVLMLTSMSSFAIFGIGGHYAPSYGSKVDGSKSVVLNSGNGQQAVLIEKEASPFTGFGGKVWIDAIPFIDIEASFNVQGVLYDAQLEFTGLGNLDTIMDLSIDPGIPGLGDADPAFGILTTDLSVKYPFLELPPGVTLLKLYVGGGYSMSLSKKLVNKEAVEKALTGIDLSSGSLDTKAIVKSLTEDLKNKDSFDQGNRFHLLVGAKFKLPVIPFAIYADGKYYFGGELPTGVTTGFTLQLGAALNI